MAAKKNPGPLLTSKSYGVPILVPEEFRRQVKVVTTKQKVPLDTDFPAAIPAGLSEFKHDQLLTDELEETKTTLTVNTNADPLLGQQTGEFGIEGTSKKLVADGTAADSGFLTKESEVVPNGDTTSVKKTVTYPNPGIAEVIITAAGTGYTNETYAFGLTGGTGSGGAGTFTVEGNVVVRAKVTAPGIYTVFPTVTFPGAGGSGAAGTIIRGFPQKISRPFDEEMLINYPRSEQVIEVITDAQAILLQAQATAGEMKELLGLDLWHARLIKEVKIPLAVDLASAIQSTVTRPFEFPGLLSLYPVIGTSPSPGAIIPANVRKTRAHLVKVKVYTYWVTSTTEPIIAVDEIFTDSPLVWTMPNSGSDAAYRQYDDVLHDAFISDYLFDTTHVLFSYPASTPSYSEYTGQKIYTGGGSSSFSNGSPTVTGSGTDYDGQISVGDKLLPFLGSAGIAVDAVTDTSMTLHSNWTGASSTTGTQFTFLSGSAWIGSDKIIAASVTPTKQKNLWKVQIEKTTMR